MLDRMVLKRVLGEVGGGVENAVKKRNIRKC